MIIARTSIAKGAPNLEGSAASHGAPLGEEEVRLLKEGMGFPVDETFYVPKEVTDFFQEKRREWTAVRKQWEECFEQWKQEAPNGTSSISSIFPNNCLQIWAPPSSLRPMCPPGMQVEWC